MCNNILIVITKPSWRDNAKTNNLSNNILMLNITLFFVVNS